MPPKRFWTELAWTDFAAGDTENWIAVSSSTGLICRSASM